jgi:hypothetical protein
MNHDVIHVQALREVDDDTWAMLSDAMRQQMLTNRVLLRQHNRNAWQKLTDAASEWCLDNATGFFRVTPRSHVDGRYEAVVWFEHESDAVNIKFRLEGEKLD